MSERGMKKWAPYKSLIEQEKYLKKAHQDNEVITRKRPAGACSCACPDISGKICAFSQDQGKHVPCI